MNYVISDVHGRLDLFKNMIDKIRFNKEDTLYVLGDIIDRGGGLEVVKYIKQLIDDGYTINCILGNHELSFINQYSNLLDKKL